MKDITKYYILLITWIFSTFGALAEKPDVETLKELSRIITDRSLSMAERAASVEKIDGDGYSYCAKALISEIDNIYIFGEKVLGESWTREYPCVSALVRLGPDSVKATMNALAKPQPEVRRRLLFDVLLRLQGEKGLQSYNFVMGATGGRPFVESEPAEPTPDGQQSAAVAAFRAPSHSSTASPDDPSQDALTTSATTEPQQDTSLPPSAPPQQEVLSTSIPTSSDLPWPVKAAALLATLGLVLLVLKQRLRNETNSGSQPQ